jgi:hypothetical protein
VTSGIGTKRTWRDVRSESAFAVKAEVDFGAVRSVLDPTRALRGAPLIAGPVSRMTPNWRRAAFRRQREPYLLP